MRGRLTVTAAVLALAAAALPSAAAAECEPVMPLSSVTTGMTGTGLTVAHGTTPESFDVEVLGILRNAIWPGRDLIIVDTSSPAIAQAGGIWAGMSGSPVYIGGQFVGAVAYSVSFSGSSIAGLTPAEDMLDVLNLPATAAIQRRGSPPATFRLPEDLARTVARREGISIEAASTFSRLRLPLSVSGTGSFGLARIGAEAARLGMSAVPYTGVSASAEVTAASIEAGENLAGVVSYGDVTAGGVGTATYTCDGKVVAFGHPLTFRGETALGLNTASAMGIVQDAFGGPYKLAEIGGTAGTLDQDRVAGIRGTFGPAPPSAAVHTTVNVPHLGRSRTGQTDVMLQSFLPTIVFFQNGATTESLFDAAAPGTPVMQLVVQGTREDGSPWTFAHKNRYLSRSPAFELGDRTAFMVYLLQNASDEEIEIGDVDTRIGVQDGLRFYTVQRVLVAKGNGRFLEREVVTARPLTRLRLRVFLRPNDGGALVRRDFTIRVRGWAVRRGFIRIGGPSSDPLFEEDFFGEFLSFDDILAFLRSIPRNDVLGVEQRAPGYRGVRIGSLLDRVVEGERYIFIRPERRAPRG